MRTAPYIASLLLLASSAGCLNVCHNAARTLCKEPKEFSWRQDRCQSKALYGAWAADAWKDQLAAGAPNTSADFATGFQCGFVEFCYAGGSGEPPPVPPRPYWNPLNRAAPYSEMAVHWFDGYRLGARVARDGGYRAQAVVPSTLPYGCQCSAEESGTCEACNGYPSGPPADETLGFPEVVPPGAPNGEPTPLEQPALQSAPLQPISAEQVHSFQDRLTGRIPAEMPLPTLYSHDPQVETVPYLEADDAPAASNRWPRDFQR